MAKRISLKYGTASHSISVKEDIDLLETVKSGTQYPAELLQENLERHFSQIKHDDKIAIVVADKTRLANYPIYLPSILTSLKEKGIKKDNIAIYIAYGTHKKQTDSDSRNAYGPTFDHYRFIHHDCDDNSLFVELGKTERQTDIAIRKDLLESDFVVTFGAISHHYFAGFGGGRKLIFPGLGKRSAILNNHKLFISNETNCLEKNCQVGELDINPLAIDLAEYEYAFTADLSIHAILDENGTVVDLICGKGQGAFKDACKRHHERYSRESKQYDNVIASAGGFPKDINLIQTHKAIHHASAFVKTGGNLFLFAECRDQIGSDSFMEWFQYDYKTSIQKLQKSYKGNGGTALALMQKRTRINIHLCSSLKDDIYQELAIKAFTADQINIPEDETCLIIENASMYIKA